MKKLTILFLILISITANTQNVFNKLIPDSNNILSISTLNIDTGYLIFGRTGDQINSEVMNIYNNGDLINVNNIRLNDTCLTYGTQYKGGIIKDSDSTYIINGWIKHTDTNEELFFAKLNTNFDTIYTRKYCKDTFYIVANTFMQLSDSNYIYFGTRSYDTISYTFIFKINQNGDSIFYKEILDDSLGFTIQIVETDDKGFLLSGFVYREIYDQYQSAFIPVTYWYFIKTDSLGNTQWTKTDNIQSVSNMNKTYDLIKTSDGNYIAVGNNVYYSSLTASYSDARLLKFSIDTNGMQILEDKIYRVPWFLVECNQDGSKFGNATIQKILELPNGNYIAIIHAYYLDNSYKYKSFLYTLSPNFNIINKQEYHSCWNWTGTTEYLYNMQLNNDGSLLLSGNVIGVSDCITSDQQLWLIKTDTNYCDGYGSCDTTLTIEYITQIPDTMHFGDSLQIAFKLVGGRDNIKYRVKLGFNSIRFCGITDKYFKNYYNIEKDSILYNI